MISERNEKKVRKMRLKSSPFLFSAQFLFDKHLPEMFFFILRVFNECYSPCISVNHFQIMIHTPDSLHKFVDMASNQNIRYISNFCHRQQQKKTNPEFKWILKWQLIPIQIQACTQRERTMKIIGKKVAKQMLHKMCGFFFSISIEKLPSLNNEFEISGDNIFA